MASYLVSLTPCMLCLTPLHVKTEAKTVRTQKHTVPGVGPTVGPTLKMVLSTLQNPNSMVYAPVFRVP